MRFGLLLLLLISFFAVVTFYGTLRFTNSVDTTTPAVATNNLLRTDGGGITGTGGVAGDGNFCEYCHHYAGNVPSPKSKEHSSRSKSSKGGAHAAR